MKKQNKDLFSDRMDRVVVGGSLLLALLCIAPLASEPIYNSFFAALEPVSDRPLIGTITFASNDIRLKEAQSFGWKKATKKSGIRLGDSLFTGEKSESHITIAGRGKIKLRSQSMVTFTKIDSIEIPNLLVGNFDLEVKGTMKVAIGGEVFEIQGDGSKVEVAMDQNQKPQIKVVKGAAQMKSATGHLVHLTTQFQPASVTPIEINPVQAVATNVEPAIEPEAQTVIEKLYDHYERNGQDLVARTEPSKFAGQLRPLDFPPPQLSAPMHVWSTFSEPQPIMIKVDKSIEALKNLVFEVSSNKQFLPESSQVLWHSYKDLQLRINEPQTIFVRARGVDSQTHLTQFSNTVEVQVGKKVIVPRLAKKTPETKPVAPEKSRAPASLADASTTSDLSPSPASGKSQSIMQVDQDAIGFLNQFYPKSKLAIEGAAFSMYSQENIDAGKSNPTALLVGLRSLSWFGRAGLEGSFKTKLMGLSSSEGGDVAPMQAEGRFHYRWSLPVSPFSSLGTSQVSAFLGYEYYRNSAKGSFAPKYDLIKSGLAFTFPLMNRWDTGGEFVYGSGLDKSTKYELSGFLSYYMNRSMSFGAGYRMHLFVAGSDASSPLGIPYREGFGEGYSVLRWHY